jgi:hypothetical protein
MYSTLISALKIEAVSSFEVFVSASKPALLYKPEDKNRQGFVPEAS